MEILENAGLLFPGDTNWLFYLQFATVSTHLLFANRHTLFFHVIFLTFIDVCILNLWSR